MLFRFIYYYEVADSLVRDYTDRYDVSEIVKEYNSRMPFAKSHPTICLINLCLVKGPKSILICQWTPTELIVSNATAYNLLTSAC